MATSEAARGSVIVAAVVGLLVGVAGGHKWGAMNAKPVAAPVAAPAATPVAYSVGPGPCVHFDGSMYKCPGGRDEEISGDQLFLRGDSITISPVSVRFRDSTYVIPIPAHVDAIFFTPEAAQILVEHYVATDRAKATKLKAHLDSLRRR